jgi:L-alanine-DL-glutamate epimerase-like enolase superfamily enzyme
MRSDVRVLEVEPYFSTERARTPLKFGAVVVEELTYCHVRARLEGRAGRVADGWGALWLMDSWSWPSPRVPSQERQRVMRHVVESYCRLVAAYTAYAHPIDIFMALEPGLRTISHEVCADLRVAEDMPFLGALGCAAPVDAALHDAFGQANGISSYDGYGPEFMSVDLSRYLGPAYRGRYPQHYLRPTFRPQVPVFHLVGGLDKLRRTEVDEGDPQDGLPNSLDEWVTRDGLTRLKVKLRGTDLAWDLERLIEVAAVGREAQAALGLNELHLSVDTNEQCADPDYMVELLRRLQQRSPQTFQSVLYVEQPTERDLRAHRFDLRALSRIRPTIVDESLTSLEDIDLALELGWSGIALKTCKCHSMALLCQAKAAELGIPYTIQDLTNPGLALTQSVGLAARMNALNGLEANSHQFFPATSEPEARVHPGIFRRRNGVLDTRSLGRLGLGHRVEEIDRPLFRRR